MINKTKKYCGFDIPEISFGKVIFSRHQGGGCTSVSIENVDFSDFNSYSSLLEKNGFEPLKSHLLGKSLYRRYKSGENTVLLSYYPSYKSARIVAESDFKEYTDRRIKRFVQPVFNQIDLTDFGLSDCILLPDGRFLVVDGGWPFEPDADALMDCLRKFSPDQKPVIAMWVMTHPDCDHYRAIIPFYEKYSGEIEIQNFLFNFPDTDESYAEPVPWMNNERECIIKLWDIIKASGAEFHRAHTGQVYNVSGAKLEVLISPDDSFYDQNGQNILSLVLKLRICGQTILLCGDTYFDFCDVLKMHGDYLKSDILQVPHHGFGGGTYDGYRLINPHTAIIPVNEYHFAMFMHNDNNKALIGEFELQDLYMGGKGNISLPLPHSPRPMGRELISARVEKLSKSSGATTWYFSDITAEDSVFTTLSPALDAEIYVDLYMGTRAETVEHIKYTVTKDCVTRINILEADGNAKFYNTNALSKKGIPENAVFTARFRSNIPVIITGSKPASYKN